MNFVSKRAWHLPYKKKRFRKPESVEHSIENVKKAMHLLTRMEIRTPEIRTPEIRTPR
jgi:hypothetical protein